MIVKKNSTLTLIVRVPVAVVLLFGVLTLIPAQTEARSKIGGKNAIAGGFGFQVGLSQWTPGGFKWFNEYMRRLSDRVWLDVQFNLTTGDMDERHCWQDYRGHWHCDDGRWDGYGMEIVLGPNLRFEMRDIPLVIDAKLGGAFEMLFFGYDYAGVGVAFRGGVGVHYFLFENFGVGLQFQFTIGPSFVHDEGAELYAAFDVQIIGCELRF